ncbi:alpha-catulin isoform X4, partial [Vespula squamosa]
MATPDPVDPATLEIKTRSIEQTLLPLVKQAHSYRSRSHYCIIKFYGACRRSSLLPFGWQRQPVQPDCSTSKSNNSSCYLADRGA